MAPAATCQHDPKRKGSNRDGVEELITSNGTRYDDDHSQNLDLLLSNPPKGCHGLGPDDLYQYRGFWFTHQRLEAIKDIQQNFQACDTDVIIATLPRSGTLWVKAMAFATINRSRYSPNTSYMSSKHHLHPLLTTSPHDLVPFLDMKHLYLAKGLPDFTKSRTTPRLLALHIPYTCLPESIKNKNTNCKIVYVCRNPKDNFISLWQFLNKLRASTSNTYVEYSYPIEEALDLFCKGMSMFGPFWDHVLGYWKESLERPKNVLFFKYEDMMKDPKSHLKRLAEFLGCGFSLKEESEGVIEDILSLCSFEHLKNLDNNKNGVSKINIENKIYFRKGQVGDWKNHLTPLMVERLDRLIEKKFHGSGLVF